MSETPEQTAARRKKIILEAIARTDDADDAKLCAAHAAKLIARSDAEAGMVLVPREPTEEMVIAWCNLAIGRIGDRLENPEGGPGMVEGMKQSYQAMIAAYEGDKKWPLIS